MSNRANLKGGGVIRQLPDGIKLGIRSRPMKERPWCWQEKAVIRQIQNAWDSKTYLDQALAVYLALTLKASDIESPTFDMSHRELVSKCGAGLTRVKTILKEFRALGIITWETNKEPGSQELLPNTYTLMLGTGCPRLVKNRNRENWPVFEESSEESQKNGREESPPRKDSGEKKSKPKLYPSEIEAKMKAVRAEISAIQADNHNFIYKSISEGGKQLRTEAQQKVKQLCRREAELRNELCA